MGGKVMFMLPSLFNLLCVDNPYISEIYNDA
jgi:hypothetical protein